MLENVIYSNEGKKKDNGYFRKKISLGCQIDGYFESGLRARRFLENVIYSNEGKKIIMIIFGKK